MVKISSAEFPILYIVPNILKTDGLSNKLQHFI